MHTSNKMRGTAGEKLGGGEGGERDLAKTLRRRWSHKPEDQGTLQILLALNNLILTFG